MSVTGLTRTELAAEVARLRGEGLVFRELAARLGISRSYADALVNDIDGAKRRARRESYQGVCARCGGVTKSNGTSKASPICKTCAVAVSKENARWTPATIVAAIQQFAAERGRPPVSAEWNETITPGRERRFPPTSTVLRVMGSWANAIEAAGYPRPVIGRSRRLKVAA